MVAVAFQIPVRHRIIDMPFSRAEFQEQVGEVAKGHILGVGGWEGGHGPLVNSGIRQRIIVCFYDADDREELVEFTYECHGAYRDVFKGTSQEYGEIALKLGAAGSYANQQEMQVLKEQVPRAPMYLPNIIFYGEFTNFPGERDCLVVQYCGVTLDRVMASRGVDDRTYVYLEAVTAALIVMKTNNSGMCTCNVNWGSICVMPTLEAWENDTLGNTAPICIYIIDAKWLCGGDPYADLELEFKQPLLLLSSCLEVQIGSHIASRTGEIVKRYLIDKKWTAALNSFRDIVKHPTCPKVTEEQAAQEETPRADSREDEGWL